MASSAFFWHFSKGLPPKKLEFPSIHKILKIKHQLKVFFLFKFLLEVIGTPRGFLSNFDQSFGWKVDSNLALFAKKVFCHQFTLKKLIFCFQMSRLKKLSNSQFTLRWLKHQNWLSTRNLVRENVLSQLPTRVTKSFMKSMKWSTYFSTWAKPLLIKSRNLNLLYRFFSLVTK